MIINFCPRCGERIVGKELFCSKCGYELFTLLKINEEPSESEQIKHLIKNLIPFVVKIQTNICEGSGFIADPTGVIVTNFHVIEGASEIFVKFAEGVFSEVENIIAVNPKIDFAVLQIRPPHNYPIKAAILGDSDSLEIGEKIIVIGNPLGHFEKTVSTGIISAFRVSENIVQMTAPISPGSSGGPVFNMKGEVIGICVSTAKMGQNINFFVPINLIKQNLQPSQIILKKIFSRKICSADTEILGMAFHPSEEKLFILSKDSKIRIFDFKGTLKDSITLKEKAINIFFTEAGELGIYCTGKLLLCNLKKSETHLYAKSINLIQKNSEEIIPLSQLTYDKELYLLSIGGKILFFKLNYETLEIAILPILLGRSELETSYELPPVKNMSLFGFFGEKYYATIICNGIVKIFLLKIEYVQEFGGLCIVDFNLVKEVEFIGVNVNAAIISPDHSSFAIALDNGEVRLSKFISLKKRFNFNTKLMPFTFSNPITSLIFDREGNYLACGNSLGEISLYKKEVKYG